MFVVYKKGYEIYGVGATPQEAKRDAVEWLEDEERGDADRAEIVERDGGVIGRFYISKCTERLASALKDESGSGLVFDWNEDDLLDVVEGEDVEE